ncbi:MAG: YraN family protein [Candidatus Omnitrophica bacterium]|nr:YraN family protein [Candidatus Omnitrophota bacterium]
MALNYEIGRRGEIWAQKFLIENGYKILEANFRCPVGELDFVCEEGNAIVFVEVKTRSHTETGMPEEAVTFRKQRQLYRVAQWYLNAINYREDRPVRFDVLSILTVSDSEDPSIELFRNALCL